MDANLSKLLGDLDELQFRLECGTKLIDAVQECIESGNHAPGEYADALFAATLFMRELSKELSTIVDSQYSAETQVNMGRTGEIVREA